MKHLLFLNLLLTACHKPKSDHRFPDGTLVTWKNPGAKESTKLVMPMKITGLYQGVDQNFGKGANSYVVTDANGLVRYPIYDNDIKRFEE